MPQNQILMIVKKREWVKKYLPAQGFEPKTFWLASSWDGDNLPNWDQTLHRLLPRKKFILGPLDWKTGKWILEIIISFFEIQFLIGGRERESVCEKEREGDTVTPTVLERLKLKEKNKWRIYTMTKKNLRAHTHRVREESSNVVLLHPNIRSFI